MNESVQKKCLDRDVTLPWSYENSRPSDVAARGILMNRFQLRYKSWLLT